MTSVSAVRQPMARIPDERLITQEGYAVYLYSGNGPRFAHGVHYKDFNFVLPSIKLRHVLAPVMRRLNNVSRPKSHRVYYTAEHRCNIWERSRSHQRFQVLPYVFI